MAGTNFLPYVKLLGTNGLGIPFAIVTDEDPVTDKPCLAHNRVTKIAETIDPEYEYSTESETLFEEAESDGVFVTDHTLEIALFRCGRHISITSTIEELSTNGKARERAKGWRDDVGSLDEKRLLTDIEKIGKGRFAQRMSSRISKMSSKACPASVKKAIEHVVEQL